MSFCGKCGTQNGEDAKFCEKCGNEINKEGTQKQTSELSNLTATVGNKMKQVNISKKFIVVAAAVIVMLIVGISFYKNQQKKLNLNDYISVEFSGYESVGSAEVKFDNENFGQALLKAKGKKAKEVDKLLKEFSLEDLAEFTNDIFSLQLQNSIKTKVTPCEGLKNGDKVTLTIEFDKDIAKENGVKFIAKEKTYIVEGLKELEEIDPFKDLEVTFSGTAPNATVTCKNKSKHEFLSYVYYDIDKESGLDNGDKIVITADVDEEDAIEQGYKLTQTSKEYTCENIDYYISSVSDLSEETLNKIQQESTDDLTAAYARISDYVTNSGLTFEGIYLLTLKSRNSWYSNNEIYAIYSTTVTSLDGDFDPTVLYIPVKYSTDLIQKANGTQEVDLSSSNLYGRSGLTYSWYSELAGYTDPTAMYNDIVVVSKDNYAADMSDNLKQFGN